MIYVSAKDAKNKFGQILDTAIKEVCYIQKHGRNVVVMISIDEYEKLKSLEDSYWVNKAEQAQKEGFIGESKSEDLLSNLLS